MSRNTECAWKVRASIAAAIGACALTAWPLQAAAAQADEEEEDELAEVQVTGTRIQNPNVTSANPVTSISGEEMRQLGIVNVADALTQLVPQNISTYSPTLVGDDQAGRGGAGMEGLDRSAFFIGNTIANLRGLDPTFGSRTLTLIDGRRVPSTSNQADVVDLNIIPSNLLQRMDVVTGGASATYGSGAMAGVVNLVLNNRLTGVNLDLDYGLNEAGDGDSPHLSLSGGMPLLGGKGHVLLGLEWQDSSAIRNCAAARSWCAESRTMLTNYTGFGQNVGDNFTPLPGYEDFPARFQMANVRRSQFAPTGTLYFNNSNVTSNLRFSENGQDTDEYALGFRGGTGSNAMNGDGPLATWLTPMRPSTERKSLFLNFEYDFTERTTAYVQANYARTDSLNKNAYTTGNYCVRFNSQGTNGQIGGTANAGVPVMFVHPFSNSFWTFWDYDTGAEVELENSQNSALWDNANFRQWLGWSNGTFGGSASFGAPYWISAANMPAYGTSPGSSTPPNVQFANGTPIYMHIRLNSNAGAEYWWLVGMVPTNDFEDPGVAPVLPGEGRNDYAFLQGLSPEAEMQVRSAFGNGGSHGAIIDQQTGGLLSGFSNTTGGGSGLDTIYGPSPCQGFTAMRKVWNPQLEQWTTQRQEPWRALAGVRGRFGRDWRWETYAQFGRTNSTSKQNNVATTLRLAMATDAVIDDRQFLGDGVTLNPTYQQPVCRVTRDGIPIIDYQGRPLSDLAALQSLADGCQPINLFGSSYGSYDAFAGSGYDAGLTQQEAIDYAFVDSISTGYNSLATLSFTTSGTLWDGYGAGPLTGAFGVEVREDKVSNQGTSTTASYYERADLSSAWADGFGGKTRVTEGYTELNMPLVSGAPGINLWSLNLGARYSSYYNKGGLGTTGESTTQNVFNWKIQTVFEPFDWVRFRLTRSRDLRAAGYRELFIQQPGLPDQFSGENPWREYNPYSNEGRRERWGQVRVGNPDLKPEKSNTLTLGLVLSPGGWAQGMRFSVDYYNIRVKGGISTPFIGSTTANIQSCWENSGNQDPTPDEPDVDPVNGNFDIDFFDAALGRYPCQEIQFAENPDGSRNLEDIISYNSARPVNGLPYQRRGLDFSWNYLFPLSRAFESLPGSLSLTLRASRVLESSGVQLNSSLANNPANCQARGGVYEDFNCYIPQDLVGQIRSSVFIPGVSASPKWTGNIITAYSVGDLTTSLSARYIGGAKLDKTWCDGTEVGGCANFQDEDGNYLYGSVDNNWVKPYFNFSLNSSYNLKVADFRQFQIFGSINNLFDKSPPFTGGGISGASSGYHDIMGRSYRFGVRMRF